MKRIEAFILDLDGVITDTAEYHYQGWKRLAKEEGIDFDRKDNEKLRGVSRRESLEILLGKKKGNYTEEEIEEMMDRKNGYYQGLLKQMTEDDLLPGARQLLDDLKERGIKVAIGSSSKNTMTVLNSLKITDEFDAIADGNSAERSKPAPDIFLYAAKELGVKPAKCVVVEDAEAGVEAALAGGMIAVGIGPDERVGKAHYRYISTAKIDLDEILNEI